VDIGHSYTLQFTHPAPDFSNHTADLPVFAFLQGYLKPSGRQSIDFRRSCFDPHHGQPLGQFSQSAIRKGPVNRNFILLFMVKRRVRKTVMKLSVIG
jgi:hypothetical protein